MAVTFKVPKSPKRDIAETDTFMGVDLTNTGVNIDGIRSPHAPNMVRHVPGKVRKRMGYYKEVYFGPKTNVNFAKDTSAREKEFIISSDDVNTWVKIYDLIKEVTVDSTQSLYLEFDYKSEEDFSIINASTTVEAAEEWTHFSEEVEFSSSTSFSDVQIFSESVQEIYIKNFSIMLGVDENYEWSPAPKYFVQRETVDPIYGCHYLRNGGDQFEGDRTSGINRALKTGTTKNLAEYSTKYHIYNLAELPAPGTKLCIAFDVELHLNGVPYPVQQLPVCPVQIYIGNAQVASGGAWNNYTRHYTRTVTVPATGEWDDFSIYGKVERSDAYPNATIGACIIKNLCISYNSFPDHGYNYAPEDNGKTFHIEDVYNISHRNYSAMDVVEEDAAAFSTSKVYTETIAVAANHITNSVSCVSFDITTTTSADRLTGITIEFLDDSGTTKATLTSDEHFTKRHVAAFFTNLLDAYIKDIKITFTVSGSTKAHLYISNIKIQKYGLKDSSYVTSKYYLYHVGKDFYMHPHNSNVFTRVYNNANEHISKSWQLNNNSYIIDGKDIYEFSVLDGGYVEKLGQDNAYIPLVTIAKDPSGGGTSYYPLNMLQPGFYEQFIGKANVTQYQLSFDGLDDSPVTAWVMDGSGNWDVKEEGTHFTVDRSLGKITFNTAPGAPPVTGQDNVRILAYRTVEDYRERITNCTFGTLFGVGGACDRIFLSGNPEHPNWDFYSQYNDGTYFPDLGYSTLGSEQSAIKGYAIVSNYLATFKDGFDASQSVFIREGDMLEVEEGMPAEATFKIINTLQGEGVLTPYSFGYLQTEPVFLTKSGIYAITEQDITGEKYSQNRSFYLDGQLLQEENPENGIATVYDNQYILAINNHLYVLDALQAVRTDKSEPYATRQYSGFYCTDIPANIIWTDDQVCFGTLDGKICRFYSDKNALTSYNDDGKPIYCCWETPDLDGKLFYKNKTFRYFAVRLMKAIKTSVKMYSRRFGIWTMNNEDSWTFIKEQNAIGNILDFNDLDFNLLSFSGDATERVIHTKLRVKKVDKARFRVENGELDEPFGISDLALEYIESGNYKG